MSLAAKHGVPKLGLRRTGAVLRVVGHYLWPEGETGLRCRVVVALVLLIVAKVTNVYVPVLYKYAVDALGEPTAQAVAVPVALILAYGVARVLAQAFGELRDAIFAPVSQRAIRNIALKVFHHLHALSLRFHLERQTGGLSRVIERGTSGMEFLIRFTTFNILPTLFEICLVGAVLWSLYDWRFSAVTLAAVGGYIAFSVILSEWRIKFVRRMNDADTEANAKAIDSLLNYETVKYFGNEEHEARRFDVGRRRYEQAAIRSSRTLSLLNVGQGAIISCGLVAVMVMAGYGVKAGTMTLGDFVAVNAFLIQLYMPSEHAGLRLSRDPQCAGEHGEHVRPDGRAGRDRRQAGSAGPEGGGRRDRVRPCRLPLREGAAHPARCQLPRGAGRHGGDRGLERGRQVDGLAHPVPLLRRRLGQRPDRRPGHPRRHPVEPARGDRRGAAGHGAVQRHDLLQHLLRPAGRHARGGRAGGAARAHPRLHHGPAAGL